MPLIAQNGGIIPFRYRGVSRIFKQTVASKNAYFLIDIIFHNFFFKFKQWINRWCWKNTRLFLIAIKKEKVEFCPAASLSIDSLMQIIEYAGWRNTSSWPFSVDIFELDNIFNSNLPSFLYRSLRGFSSPDAIQQIFHNIPQKDKYPLYLVQEYFSSCYIKFHTVENICKRIANFSSEAVVYFSHFIQLIAQKLLRSQLWDREKQLNSHHIFWSTVSDGDFLQFLEGLECKIEWKWFSEDKLEITDIPSTIKNARPHELTQSQQKILEKENYLRKAFVEKRESTELSNFYIDLIDVYENVDTFRFTSLDKEESSIPMILCPNREKFPIGESSINSFPLFLSYINEFSSACFEGFNWDNVFLAGGVVLGSLTPNPEGFRSSDLDLFIYGLSKEEANDKVESILSQIQKNFASLNPILIVRTNNSITVIRGFPHRNIQIVLRLYKSPAEVLLGFDVDSCSIGFDGKKVWITERGQRAINKRYNLVNPTRRSSSYEYRLWKYSKRGFGVCVPTLDGTKINEDVLMHKEITSVKGLAKLVFYECGKFRNEFLPTHKKNKKDIERDEFEKETQDLNIICSKVDYSHVIIPYGPKWDLVNISRFLNNRNWGFYWKTKEPSTSFIQTYAGLEDFRAKRGRDTLIWLVDNPGRQQFEGSSDLNLLRGSFYPLPSIDWEKDLYTKLKN